MGAADALGGKWRTVLLKEQPGDMVYDLYAHGGGASKVPVDEIYVGGARTASGTTALTVNTWAHLASTFDGATLSVYVNGTLVGQQAVSGSIATSTAPFASAGTHSGPSTSPASSTRSASTAGR